MGHTIADFQPTIAAESIIERDPAKGESLGRAGAFEVFIQRGLRQHVGARPAIAGHDEGLGIRLITDSVHQIHIDQPILWRDGRSTSMGRSDCARGSTRS